MILQKKSIQRKDKEDIEMEEYNIKLRLTQTKQSDS